MKKEQIVDMIGEAPDNYVKDAKEYKKKRRIPRWSKWMGGIAAVFASLRSEQEDCILLRCFASISCGLLAATDSAESFTISKAGGVSYHINPSGS